MKASSMDTHMGNIAIDMEVIAQREKDRTESLFKQTADSLSFTLESLGTMVSGAVSTATGFVGSLFAGIFKGLPLPLKAIVIVLIIVIVFCVAQRVCLIIKKLLPAHKPQK